MSMHLIWSNGRVLPRDEFRIDPNDEGLLFGLGLFETTRTVAGTPLFWEEHCDRLLRSAPTVGISSATLTLPTAGAVTHFVRQVSAQDVAVRLNVSAGTNDRPPTVWMLARPLLPRKSPVALTAAAVRVYQGDPFAAVKCFHYGHRLLAHRQAVAAGFDDAILLSTGDHVLETCRANLFLRHDTQWSTPTLTGGVLPGTVRQWLLPRLSGQERAIQWSELQEADEILLTNSVIGAVSVNRIDGQQFAVTEIVDELTQTLLTSPSNYC